MDPSTKRDAAARWAKEDLAASERGEVGGAIAANVCCDICDLWFPYLSKGFVREEAADRCGCGAVSCAEGFVYMGGNALTGVIRPA